MEAGPLLRQALSPANLLTAWNRVAANRGMAGVDGETIDGIAPQVHGVLDEIAAGVWAGSYRPAALRRVWMARPGKPPRGLAVPTVRDRILHAILDMRLPLTFRPEDCAQIARILRAEALSVAQAPEPEAFAPPVIQ